MYVSRSNIYPLIMRGHIRKSGKRVNTKLFCNNKKTVCLYLNHPANTKYLHNICTTSLVRHYINVKNNLCLLGSAESWPPTGAPSSIVCIQIMPVSKPRNWCSPSTLQVKNCFFFQIMTGQIGDSLLTN